MTITSIVNNGNGTVTISYSGGGGASFTLMKSSVVPNPLRDSWTPVGANQPATPGAFTITPAGNEFYTHSEQLSRCSCNESSFTGPGRETRPFLSSPRWWVQPAIIGALTCSRLRTIHSTFPQGGSSTF